MINNYYHDQDVVQKKGKPEHSLKLMVDHHFPLAYPFSAVKWVYGIPDLLDKPKSGMNAKIIEDPSFPADHWIALRENW